MLRSLRSRFILGSILWTAGLLMLMHVLSMLLFRIFPLRGHSIIPVITGLVLMACGLLEVRQSFKPFHRLRDKLMAVRHGDDKRVEGPYPAEVQPLVDDLNGLLADRDAAVKRAMATAGDLAHGLKTPLALLAQQADHAAAAGRSDIAKSIRDEVERMSRQMNYHLARARAAASGTGAGACPVAASANALIRTLLKLHANRTLEISCAIAPDLHARVQREDLDEMLGNVLDNACKWAHARISVEAARTGGELVLTVDDDGPGLAPALRGVVLRRGIRLDEASPGSGLGLAIVRDLAELYGGSVALGDAPLGGLRARISLPAAETNYVPASTARV